MTGLYAHLPMSLIKSTGANALYFYIVTTYDLVIVFTFRYIMNRSRYSIVAFTAFLSMAVLLPQLCHALSPEERRKLFNIEANYKKCAEKRLDVFAIDCIAPTSYLAHSYLLLYRTYEEPDKELGIQYLRLQALSETTMLNKAYLKYIRLAGVNHDEFYTLFEDAIEWSIAERSKSAGELYEHATSYNPLPRAPEIGEYFRNKYLMLAKEKSPPNYKEL